MTLRLLMALIIGPLAALAGYFLWLDITKLNTTILEAELAAQDARELAVVTALVHELQKERGFSVGFRSSDGEFFGDELRAQRRETDRASAQVQALLAERATAGAEPRALPSAGLTALAATRSQVDAQALTVPDIAAVYTRMVEAQMSDVQASANRIADPRLRPASRAVAMIGLAKESAGLERAMGAAGLGQERFPLDIYARFFARGAAQDSALALAAFEMDDPAAFDTLRETGAYQRISGLRQAIQAAMAQGSQPGIAPEDWFTAATAWIDMLRETEVAELNDVNTMALDVVADARATLRKEIVVASAVILAVLAFAVGTFEYIISRVKRLTRAMDRFTDGDFEVFIPGIDGRDEIGRMARAVYRFKQETLAMRRAAAEQKADDEAIILGKAQEVVDLVTEGLAALAQADLTCQFDTPLASEYDAIRSDFNAATRRLRDVMQAIAQTAVDLDQRADALMQSADDLGARTSEQVDTIASTNDRVSALSSEVASYADNVRDASARASSAKTTADRSGTVVNSAVEAMDRIAASSREIGRIISMIEDITFQTNLLALNAGVEAARAGESGRGFAVVASEVRELAKRSSAATQEIKDLIEESGKTVREGVGLVAEAGKSLSDIFAEIHKVDEVLIQVADGSTRQAQNLLDIAAEITRLNDLANRNVDAVDASGQSSRETARISKQMTQLIQDFRLQGGTAPHAPLVRTA